MQNLKKNQLVVSKNLMNFDPCAQVSKICTLIGSFCAKYVMFYLKRYKGVLFHDTEEPCKIWRKTCVVTCVLKNDTRNLSNFHQSTQKFQKMLFLWGPFIQKRKCMSLNFTGQLCVMTMKNNAKFEKKLTWGI